MKLTHASADGSINSLAKPGISFTGFDSDPDVGFAPCALTTLPCTANISAPASSNAHVQRNRFIVLASKSGCAIVAAHERKRAGIGYAAQSNRVLSKSSAGHWTCKSV